MNEKERIEEVKKALDDLFPLHAVTVLDILNDDPQFTPLDKTVPLGDEFPGIGDA